MNFEVKKSEVLFRGKVFDLKVDEIEYNSGNKGIREVAVHPGGAVIFALKGNDKIILIKQFRYPFKDFLLELPAGKLEKNEDPLNCAKRELEEETGFTANKWTKLGQIYTSPGFSSEILHIYLAENLKDGRHNREEGEYGMEVHEYSFIDIADKIKKGEIVDSKTICGFYMAKNHLLSSK